jgi:plastocyanin
VLALVFLTALVVIVGPAPPSSAGVIRGTLKLPPVAQKAPSAHLYPGRASSLPVARTMMYGAVEDAVVWIENVPAAADTAHHSKLPKLAQKGQCFTPRVLAVPPGTTVDFPNMDAIFHNVFSASPARRFDLGKYPRGHSKRVTFDRPGLVHVYCDIHSNMEAFILILPTRAFTQPSAGGSFVTPSVPPGHYVLHVWHPDVPETTQEVQVPETGDLALEVGS